jgi:chitin disaccharide deacetylase
MSSVTSAAVQTAKYSPPDHVRNLIVCADDFGIEVGVDAAIVELAQRRRLSATGCLVTSTVFPQSAPALFDLPIDIGLHLNFTEFLGEPGFYKPLGTLIALSYLRKLPRFEVRAHIEHQLDLFERHLKRAPDFIDGHLHVHQLPVIRDELIAAMMSRYQGRLPWLRDTAPTPLSGKLPLMQRLKAHVIGALGSDALVRKAKNTGIMVNDGFMGAYDFSRSHPPYLSMLTEWLKGARHNSLLMTHPAQSASAAVAFGDDRVLEYKVLASDTFAELLGHYALQITRLSTQRSDWSKQ